MKNDVGMSWEMYDFSDLVNDITGGNRKFQSFEYQANAAFPIVDQSEKFISGFTNENAIVKRKKDVVIFGDHTKALKFIDFDFCLGADGVKVLEPVEELDSKFLFYFLNTITLPNVGYSRHFKFLKEISIPLPPLPIQKRIAEILDAADALKLKDQALLKKYDELAQAIFIDMFGDPVKNEKGWEVKSIREFGKISTGNTPSRAESKNYNSNYIEWIKTDNIEDGSLYISKANEYLSEIGFQRGRATTTGSLLVACIAGSIDSIGRAALTNREVTFNQQINSIEPNEKVNSIFLYYLIKYSRKHIQNHASNGMKRMLSKGEFEKIKLILPNLNIQQEFERKINHVIIQNEKVKNALANSGNLFQALIQKAFKGELVK